MLRKTAAKLFLLFVLAYGVYWLFNRDKLVLKKITLSEVDEIDTIEAYPQRGLFILGLVRYGFLGRFSFHLGIAKNRANKKELLLYEVKSRELFRVSKDYLSFVDVKEGKTNWGWFAVENGKVLPTLPGEKHIRDSIEEVSKGGFVGSRNGYINSKVEGRTIREVNYGNIVTKYKQLNFDSLDYNLYQLQGDSIVTVSGDGDDLFKQTTGVFFIPKPGYGVKYKYNKKVILDVVDSMSAQSNPSNAIRFKPEE